MGGNRAGRAYGQNGPGTFPPGGAAVPREGEGEGMAEPHQTEKGSGSCISRGSDDQGTVPKPEDRAVPTARDLPLEVPSHAPFPLLLLSLSFLFSHLYFLSSFSGLALSSAWASNPEQSQALGVKGPACGAGTLPSVSCLGGGLVRGASRARGGCLSAADWLNNLGQPPASL